MHEIKWQLSRDLVMKNLVGWEISICKEYGACVFYILINLYQRKRGERDFKNVLIVGAILLEECGLRIKMKKSCYKTKMGMSRKYNIILAISSNTDTTHFPAVSINGCYRL